MDRIGRAPGRCASPSLQFLRPTPEALRNEANNSGQFRIERTGAFDLPQNVYFSLSGSAEAGLDFERIDGMITIPTGESYTYVYINPSRATNRPANVNVDATLDPLPQSEYGLNSIYSIGTPNSATVWIGNDAIPSDPLNLRIILSSSNTLQVTVHGQSGYAVVLEHAIGLSNWIPLGTNVISNGEIVFTNSASFSDDLETFRARYH